MPHERYLGSHLPAEFRKNTRQKRREKGLCTQCADPVEGDLFNRATGKKRSMCRKCLVANAEKIAGYRKTRKEAGLCERCGKNPPKPNRLNCLDCVTRMSANQKRHRHLRFFDKRARTLKGYSVGFAKQLAFLWKKQKGFCMLTGLRLNRNNAEVDHITPKSKGGTNDIDNLRWVIRDVNQAKRALSDADFLLLCKSVVSWAEKRS